MDETKEIEKEYFLFFNSHLEEYGDHLAIKLLDNILRAEDGRKMPLPVDVSTHLYSIFENYECTTKVEPELLGMATNARDLNLVLLLAGQGIACTKLRHRGSNNESTRSELQRQIPWLDIRFASDTAVHTSIFNPLPKKTGDSRIFEFLVKQRLQTENPLLRFIDTPPELRDEMNRKVEIDIYGHEQREEGVVLLWIGECKQRREGNEQRELIKIDEINQLRRKIDVAKRYERIEEDTLVRGILVSNAVDFWDNIARDWAKKVGVEFWHAELTKGWTNDQHWRIRRLTRKL